MQKPIGGLGNEGPSILSHTANGFGDPSWIASEQFVILGCSKMSNQAQFDHQLIDECLGGLFVDQPQVEITLNIDVKESRVSAQTHGCSIVFLNSGKIRKIQPLHRLLGVSGRAANVITVF